MAKRRKQWVGGSDLIVSATDASTAVSDITEMIPAELSTAAVGQNTQCLIEAIYLKFSIRRLLITSFDALGFMVWVANVAETGNTPVQALNALSTTARTYGNKNIMMMAPLPVSPLLAASDLLTFVPNDEILVADHEYQANRKLDRSNQVLSLTVNSDVDAVVQVFAQWRVLLTYAG